MKKPTPKRAVAQNNQPDQKTSVQVQRYWSGPLPPPETLAQFNDVLPNGAEVIVTAWIDESRHRRKVESREQILFYGDMILGKLCALLFVAGALGLSAYAAYLGTDWLAAVLAGGTIAAVVGAFLKVQQRNK